MKIKLTILFTIFMLLNGQLVNASLWGDIKKTTKSKNPLKQVLTSPKKKPSEKKIKSSTKQQQPEQSSTKAQSHNSGKSTYKGKLDIVGLELGMTVEQVISVLKKRNSSYKITTRKHERNNSRSDMLRNSEYVTSILATLPNNKEVIVISFPHPPSKLSSAIKRTVYFKEGKKPLYQSVKKSLESKYGLSLYQMGMPHRRYWFYDQEENLRAEFLKKEANNLNVMSQTTRCGASLSNNNNTGYDRAFTSLDEVCGLMILANIYADNVDNSVSSIRTILSDGILIKNNSKKYWGYKNQLKTEEIQKKKEKAKKNEGKFNDF